MQGLETANNTITCLVPCPLAPLQLVFGSRLRVQPMVGAEYCSRSLGQLITAHLTSGAETMSAGTQLASSCYAGQDPGSGHAATF